MKIHPKFHLSAKDKGKINAAHYSLLIAQQIALFSSSRSFSEVSGVSGSFSAELDAVYRLYCREYELQLQLHQQQIELQKQQLQLQQQLQQVENLQQQQQQQQQTQQQQQQQQQQQPKLLTSMEMETKVTDVEVLMHCSSVKEKRDFYFL